MKKNVLVPGLIILILCFLMLLVSPYNLVHYFNAENKVTKILFDSEVKLALLGEDSEVTNVQYLGSNFYRLETQEGIYLVEIKSKKSTNTIDVFEHKIYSQQFMN